MTSMKKPRRDVGARCFAEPAAGSHRAHCRQDFSLSWFAILQAHPVPGISSRSHLVVTNLLARFLARLALVGIVSRLGRSRRYRDGNATDRSKQHDSYGSHVIAPWLNAVPDTHSPGNTKFTHKACSNSGKPVFMRFANVAARPVVPHDRSGQHPKG